MKEMRCNNEDRTPRDTSLRDVRMKVKDAQSYDGVIQNTASFLLRVCVCVCVGRRKEVKEMTDL